MKGLALCLVVLVVCAQTNAWRGYLRVVPRSTYDYIVVGAGTAGSVVANRLSEDPQVSVLLLESGGDDRGRLTVTVPALSSVLWNTPASWRYYTEPRPEAVGLLANRTFSPMGRILGGTSSLQGMQYARGSRHDYDRWANHTGDETWDYRHVLPYFKKSEGMKSSALQGSEYHGTDGPLAVNFLRKRFPVSDVILRACQEAGHPLNEDYNGRRQTGVAFTQTNINTRTGRRISTSTAFVHPVLGRRNLHVVVNAHVIRINVENSTATGVVMKKLGRQFVVTARREVVVSAGAIASPQLLMLSGIGPRDHLEELGIPVKASLPVGQGLQDHQQFHVTFSITEPISATVPKDFLTLAQFSFWFLQYVTTRTGFFSTPLVETALYLRTDNETEFTDWPNLEIEFPAIIANTQFMQSMNFDTDLIQELSPSRDSPRYGFTCLPISLSPKSRGRVRLRSTDAFDAPKIENANGFDHQEDVDVLLKGVEVCKNLVNTTLMRQIGAKLADTTAVSLCSQHVFDSRDYWECLIRATPVTTYHPASTCAMGPAADNSSVVDSQLRVWGVAGLRVVDASVMPYVTSGNTHAPTVMLAEKASDMIKGEQPLPPLDPES